MSDDLFSNLTAEELQQLLALGGLDDQGGMLDQRMQQAVALRNPSGRQHSSAAGAALGGLGDILRGVASYKQEGDIRAQQEALLKQKTEGRSLFADLLRRRNAPQPQDAYTSDDGVAVPSFTVPQSMRELRPQQPAVSDAALLAPLIRRRS